MYYQLQMQAESHPNEQHFSCYVYNIPLERARPIPTHCHSYNEIIYAIEETACIEVNGKTLFLEPGEMVFIPPLAPHATNLKKKEGRSFILQFSNRFFTQALGVNLLTYHPRFENNPENFVINTTHNPSFSKAIQSLTELCMIFPDQSLPPEQQHEISGLCSEDEPQNDVEITPFYWQAKGLSLLLLSELIQQKYLVFNTAGEVTTQEMEQLKPLITEMIQAPEKSMTMERAAQIANMSYHNFCRTFKRLLGTSFVEYKNFLRVQYAEQILLETDRSITEIAEFANFGNLSYFNRIFKQYTDMTPSEYRSRKQKRTKSQQN